MQPTTPSADELAALLSEHADRFPEKYKITVRGDHGAAVSLPFLLVNPTEANGSGWADFLRTLMKLAPGPADLDDRLSSQVIAWPRPKEWATWLQRWPSLGTQVASAFVLKVAASGAAWNDPAPDECAPAPLTPILDSRPRGVWVRAKTPDGASYVLVVEAPAPPVWRIFKKSITAVGSDVVKIAGDLAATCIIGCARELPGEGDAPATYTTEPHTPLLARYIGLVAHVVAEVGSLAGAAADVSQGGW